MQTVRDHVALGGYIRQERKRQKLTQEQLAALTGVGIRYLRELEKGKESCQIGLAFAVLNTLGLSLTISGRGHAV